MEQNQCDIKLDYNTLRHLREEEKPDMRIRLEHEKQFPHGLVVENRIHSISDEYKSKINDNNASTGRGKFSFSFECCNIKVYVRQTEIIKTVSSC